MTTGSPACILRNGIQVKQLTDTIRYKVVNTSYWKTSYQTVNKKGDILHALGSAWADVEIACTCLSITS